MKKAVGHRSPSPAGLLERSPTPMKQGRARPSSGKRRAGEQSWSSVEKFKVPLSALERFFSPLASPRPTGSKSVGKQSTGSVLNWKTCLSTEKKTGKKKEPKSKMKKSMIGASGIKLKSLKKEDRSKFEPGDFWTRLQSLRISKAFDSSSPRGSAIISKSIGGLGLINRVRGGSRETGVSEKVTGDASLARSFRRVGEKSDWSMKKSGLISPGGHHCKAATLRERPNHSDMTGKIKDGMKKNVLGSTSRVRHKVNSEVSAISLVGLEEQFKYHQSKMRTKNKVSLLGMKVDKLIKAVQESNSKVQSKTLTDYLGFDKFTKKSSPNTPAKSSRRLLTQRHEVMNSFADYNLCQAASHKPLLLRQHASLQFCKRVTVKKNFMPRQSIMIRDTPHLPEVKCFVRHPDQPDSRPIFNLLLTMMPARDSVRPQLQEALLYKLKQANSHKRSADKQGLLHQASFDSGRKTLQDIPRLTKSKAHARQEARDVDSADSPNLNLRSAREKPNFMGISNEFLRRNEICKAESGSISNRVESDATRLLSPFASPIHVPESDKNRTSGLKQLRLQPAFKRQEVLTCTQTATPNDHSRLPEHEAVNESSLMRLLTAKRAILQPAQNLQLKPPQPSASSKWNTDRQNDSGGFDPETPKFLDSPKAKSKQLNLLASLKQLKSTLPKKKFPN